MDTVKFLLYFSDFIVPFTMFYIVVYGFFNRNDVYESFLKGVKEGFQIVIEIAPTMIAFIVRIFSSSAAVSFVLDIFKEYGPDSRLGMIVSIMMSCTETVIYTITIYYMSVNIKKTRWTLPGAMFATIAGAVASVAITELIM